MQRRFDFASCGHRNWKTYLEDLRGHVKNLGLSDEQLAAEADIAVATAAHFTDRFNPTMVPRAETVSKLVEVVERLWRPHHQPQPEVVVSIATAAARSRLRHRHRDPKLPLWQQNKMAREKRRA